MAASRGVAISIDSEDQVAREVGDPRTAREAHRRADFLTQDLEGAGNAGGAVGGETPEGGSPDRHHLRPARKPLHHIGPAREAAVDHDLDAIAHGVGDGGQRVDGRLRLVELTTAVVGDPDQAHPHVRGAAGVAHRHDPLQPHRELRRLHQPQDVVPRETRLVLGGRPARVGRDLHGLARAQAREDVALAATVELHVHGEGDRQVPGGLDAREQLTDPPAVSVVVELNICGAAPALATSSTGHPVAPESHWRVSALAAPRAISTSPSGWKRMRPPMGAIDTGHARGTPRRLVRRSIWRTSMRTCCWIARRSRWRRLRRSVVSVSAPPSPKFHTSRGRRPRAARRISGSVTKRGGWLMPPYYTLPREGTDADVSGPGTSGGAFRRRPARPPDSPDC